MSHSGKDTNDEIDVKAGRRIQSAVGSEIVHSPLRRSSRVKSLVKQNESSPETAVGDDINNIQLKRNTRRRIDSVNYSAITEKSRTLRSRRSSVTSDMIGTPDTDATIVTSVKKDKNISDNEELNNTDFQTSRRFKRAGSEAKSPSVTSRPTRRTRASSMGPEAIIGGNLIETDNNESKLISVNTRKRISMLSLKTSMLEETMMPVVTLDRILPIVKEINEKGLENPIVDETSKSESTSKVPFNTSSDNTCKKATETDLNAKEVHNSFAEGSPAVYDTEVNNLIVDKITVLNTGDTKDTPMDTTSSVAAVQGTLKTNCKISPEDTIGKYRLEIENLIDTSIKEEDEHLSDKENQPANIIDSTQSKEDTISNVLLQSPKQIVMNNLSANKLMKDSDNETDSSDNIQKLVITDTKSLCETPHNDNIDQNASSIEICDDSSINKNTQIVKCPDNLSNSNNDKIHNVESKIEEPAQEVISDSETFSKDKNVVAILTSEVEVQQSSKENIAEQCKESSDLHMRSEDFKSINEKEDEVNSVIKNSSSTDVYLKLQDVESMNEKESEVINVTKNSQASTVTDISVGYTEVSEKNVTQDMSILDKSSASEKKYINNSGSCEEVINESEIQEICKKDEENVKADGSKSCEEAINESGIQEICKKDEENMKVDGYESREEAINESGIQEICKKDEENMKVDGSESREEAINESGIQEICKKDEENIKVDDSESCEEAINESGIQKTCKKDEENMKVDGPESCKETTNESEIQETSKKDEKTMKVDDNSDSNIEMNLFQDIPADEWKEHNSDKNSLHSISTEKLEDESENECDLVLVDKETCQTTEDMDKEENKKLFNYDSDNILLQAQKDELKMQKTEQVHVSEDQCIVNDNKSPKMKTLRQSMQREKVEENKNVIINLEDESQELEKHKKVEAEKTQSAENVCTQKSEAEKTVTKFTVQNNTSVEKIEENMNLTIESEEDLNKLSTDLSLDKSKLFDNVSKKRISLCKPIEMIDGEAEESSGSETVEGKKSMNKLRGSLLCDSSSSSKSDKSMDSDIEREYNLHGDEPSKFSDDDVLGDECRASETESSDSNDNGSDLADFVVNDDDISEEEEQKSESDKELCNKEDSEGQESDVDKQYGKAQISKKNEKKVIRKEQRNKTAERNIESVINKSLDISNKKKGELKETMINVSLPEMFEKANENKKKLKNETANKKRKNEVIKDNDDKIIKAKPMKHRKRCIDQVGESNETETSRKGMKRISQEILENLSDVPSRVLKKRKQLMSEKQELPSRSMNNLTVKKNKINVEHDFISLSSYGGTTNFYVENLQKLMKSKKTSEVQTLRQRMLQRNVRQHVSHYLMYLEKQKSSDKRKLHKKLC